MAIKSHKESSSLHSSLPSSLPSLSCFFQPRSLKICYITIFPNWDAEAAFFQLPYIFASEISRVSSSEERKGLGGIFYVVFYVVPPVSSPFHLPEENDQL